MKTWLVLYKKELFSFWRSSKWLWLPIVFTFLSVSQPISLYYMPEILKSAGNLPEGAVFEIPIPLGTEVMAGVLSQYGTVGLVIIVVAVMGSISSERQRGTMSLLMSRPVSSFQFVTSKWAAEVSLLFITLVFSYGFSAYYTNLLFSDVSIELLWKSFFIYFIWVCFIVTITVIGSILFKSNGIVMGVSISIIALLSLLDNFFEKFMKWSPSLLSTQASSVLINGKVSDYFFLNIFSSLTIIIVLLAGGIFMFKKQEKY